MVIVLDLVADTCKAQKLRHLLRQDLFLDKVRFLEWLHIVPRLGQRIYRSISIAVSQSLRFVEAHQVVDELVAAYERCTCL